MCQVEKLPNAITDTAAVKLSSSDDNNCKLLVLSPFFVTCGTFWNSLITHDAAPSNCGPEMTIFDNKFEGLCNYNIVIDSNRMYFSS